MTTTQTLHLTRATSREKKSEIRRGPHLEKGTAEHFGPRGASESPAETAPVIPALAKISPRFVTRIGYPPS
jgi:hypothetical protein